MSTSGGLPGGPHGECADGVDGLLRVETHAAPGRAAGIVVLHPKALEDLHRAVVETNRKCQAVLVSRGPQQRPGRSIEPHEVGQPVELVLRVSPGIEGGSSLIRPSSK